jgi:hypothetical protein
LNEFNMGYASVTMMVVVGVAALFAIVWLRNRKRWLSLFLLAGLILCCCVFFLLTRRQTLLGHGEPLSRGSESYFCELDCHLAYSIADVRQAKRLKQVTAEGTFYIVTIRTRFDETTIGPTRGNAPLQPNPRRVLIVDSDEHTYEISPTGQAALKSTGESGTPLTTPLRPGESYLSTFVFDLPPTADSPALFIDETDWASRIINKLAHKNRALSL